MRVVKMISIMTVIILLMNRSRNDYFDLYKEKWLVKKGVKTKIRSEGLGILVKNTFSHQLLRKCQDFKILC